ncbi:MAG: hypothetical protein LBC80_05565 [Treponema sp.]|jgi:hypothetical protein|nr:hypothetical protein [Treponema sp.]
MVQKFVKVLSFLGILVYLFACKEPGAGLSPVVAIPEVPRKELLTTFGTVNPHYVRTILHIDIEKYNPLNAMDFFFGWIVNGVPFDDYPFFEYVVLGHAYLTQDVRGNVALKLTPSLQYVLDNNKTYIQPLILKGIKVLIEVRSGCFNDDEPGFYGVGFGAMDMPSVNLFAPQLHDLVNQYGIDGFEFNDIGGGYRAYPPYTRDLKQFGTNEPLYPDEMFQDKNGNELSDAEIKEILWSQGGANFSDMIIYINEHLKERRSVPADYGGAEYDGRTIEIFRSLVTRRDNGHGRYLHTETRPAFIPDAYTGATPLVLWNMIAFVNGISNEMENDFPFLEMWDDALKRHVKQEGMFFSPFIIDLSVGESRLSAQEARVLASAFAGTASAPNRFGTLYFSNLPTIEEDPGIASFLTNFTTPIFGRPLYMYENGDF